MNKAESLNRDAARLEREAKKLRGRAVLYAENGCVFMAADCDELAVKHERAAAQLRLSAIAHEGG